MPEFAEPWEAQVFALAVSLSERGVFSWSEWTSALAAEDVSYASAGLDTLERLVTEKGLTDDATLSPATATRGRTPRSARPTARRSS